MKPQKEESLKRKRGIFTKDLRLMLFGFGDDPDPLPETVDLVEDIVFDYITEMVYKAQEISPNRHRITVEHILFLIRKDAKKYYRVKELLRKNEEFKAARKAFDVDVEKLGTD